MGENGAKNHGFGKTSWICPAPALKRVVLHGFGPENGGGKPWWGIVEAKERICPFFETGRQARRCAARRAAAEVPQSGTF